VPCVLVHERPQGEAVSDLVVAHAYALMQATE
jgi:hypothetical protein